MDTSLWRTGDLIAFSGSGFFDTLIKWWTGKWTHVGMVDMTIPSSPLLIQSTPAHGVAPMEVTRAIKEEGGKAFWVAVKVETAMVKNPHYQADLLAFMRQHYGDEYDWGGIVHFVLPFFKRIKGREFCSYLIAMADESAQLLTGVFKSPSELIANPIYLEAIPI